LVDAWQEQRTATAAAPPISIAVLEDVAVVLSEMAGDVAKADHIVAWVASSRGL
jgi:hypothetical protein